MCTYNRLMKFPLEEEIIISRNQPVTIIPSVLLVHLSFASYTNHPLKYTGLGESSNCVAVVCLSLTQGVGSFSDLGSFPPSFSPPFLLFSLPFSCSPSLSPSCPPALLHWQSFHSTQTLKNLKEEIVESVARKLNVSLISCILCDWGIQDHLCSTYSLRLPINWDRNIGSKAG